MIKIGLWCETTYPIYLFSTPYLSMYIRVKLANGITKRKEKFAPPATKQANFVTTALYFMVINSTKRSN